MKVKKRLNAILLLLACGLFGYLLIISMYTTTVRINALDTYGEATIPAMKLHSLESDLDDSITYRPELIYVFFTWILLVFVPLFFIKNEQEFNHIVFAYIFVISISILATLVYPVIAPRQEVSEMNSATNLLTWYQEHKLPINMLPSFVVSLSILAGLAATHINKDWGWIVLIYSVLVAASGLFIKEISAINGISGVVLSLISYYLFIVKKGLE